VAPAAGGTKTKDSALLVRPTQAGRQAQRVWEPLTGVVEDRWRERLGRAEVERLRTALAGVVSQFSVELPYVLPAGDPRLDERRPASGQEAQAALPSLLSKVLLAFALDFGRTSDLALGQYTAGRSARLAVSANILRVLDEQGVRASEIPARTGVAKMTIDNWLGALQKHGYATVSPDPAAGRFKVVRLTAKGRAAKDLYQEWAGEAGQRWAGRFGERTIRDLRDAARPLSGHGTGQRPLWRGLEPYPDCWRAQVPAPATLPHYPVISVRGGFPDGS
jgi:DNA-binding MarR family transcriptional regulator